MTQTRTQPSFGTVQAGIVLLTLATAFIHLYFALFDEQMSRMALVLFTLNFLGYVTLVSALYAPVRALARLRPLTRALLVAFAATTIAGYFYVGVFELIGWIDKAIEALLIALLLVEAASNRFVRS